MSAILAAAAIGAGASLLESNRASDEAARARESQEALAQQQLAQQQEQLEFSQEQLDMWQDTYGDIEQSLSNYYNQLKPDSYERQAVTNLQQAYQTKAKQLRESQAQRGLAGSGIEARTQQDLAMQTARDEATIRTQAPQVVTQQQQGFLSSGLQQKPSIVGGVTGAMGGLSNIYGQQQTVESGRESLALQQQANAMAGLGSVLGQTAQYYGTQDQDQSQPTIQPEGTFTRPDLYPSVFNK